MMLPIRSKFIPNYNVVNAYVDTSYVRYPAKEVVVSSFSSDDGDIQERVVTRNLRVNAKDGYKFNLENLSEYSFDVQFLNSKNLDDIQPTSYTHITLEDFEPVPEDFDFVLDDIFHMNIDPKDTMLYRHNSGNVDYIILLYGGIREKQLSFLSFWDAKSDGDFTLEGTTYIATDLFQKGDYDDDWEFVDYVFLNNLNFIATSETEEPIEDVSNYLFNTYYIDSSELSSLKGTTAIDSRLILNTYSYPIVFPEDVLIDVDLSLTNISQNISVKKFLKNVNSVEIFKFTIPDIPDVSEVRVRIPFNNDVVLNYEDVRGKTITGRFVYEVLTNTTTLFISDGAVDIYKTIVGVGVVVPYKPTGQFDSGTVPTNRLSVDEPKLFIKGVGQTIKGNYIQGSIGKMVENMLNSERDKLNSLLKDGVYYND